MGQHLIQSPECSAVYRNADFRHVLPLSNAHGLHVHGDDAQEKLRLEKIPLGVIGIIYESRPNVTVDAAALCVKAGNAVILRGGSEAIRSKATRR